MSPQVRVGCCGFATSLARYARTFPVVEVQQTFYQPPLARTVERWRRQVPEHFEFTVKAWQLITHEATSPTYRRLREKLSESQKREAGAFRLNGTVMTAWQRTLQCARILRSRVILFQCPARLNPTPEHKANLRAFFRELRRRSAAWSVEEGLIYVWEPRGEWRAEEVGELATELDLVHGVDPFQQLSTTSGLGYFRLHGRTGYRYRYTPADLEKLLEMTQPRDACFALFNNVSMLEDARRFQRLASSP